MIDLLLNIIYHIRKCDQTGFDLKTKRHSLLHYPWSTAHSKESTANVCARHGKGRAQEDNFNTRVRSVFAIPPPAYDCASQGRHHAPDRTLGTLRFLRRFLQTVACCLLAVPLTALQRFITLHFMTMRLFSPDHILQLKHQQGTAPPAGVPPGGVWISFRHICSESIWGGGINELIFEAVPSQDCFYGVNRQAASDIK